MSFLRDNRTLVLVCLVVALAATTVRAQQRILWQGAVKPEHINVYTSASASESVVRTLGRGQVVNVVLEVSVVTLGVALVPGRSGRNRIRTLHEFETGEFHGAASDSQRIRQTAIARLDDRNSRRRN
jgi:hypothetical protein